jgi:hypothetical protein
MILFPTIEEFYQANVSTRFNMTALMMFPSKLGLLKK